MFKRSLFYNWFQQMRKPQLHLVLLGFFFLGFFHYTEPNPGGIGLEVPNNNAAWIAISFIIGLALFAIAREKKIVYSQLTVWLFVCVCCLCIPTFYPESKLINESPLHLALLGGFLFYSGLQQFKPDIKLLNIILFMVLSAVIIEAVIAWHTYFGISWLHFSMEGPGFSIPYGAVRQRNSLSTLFVTGLIISAWLLDPKNREDFSENLNKVFTCLIFLTPILLIPLVVILKSRTGWISASVSLTLVLPYLWIIKANKIVLAWILAVILGLLVVPMLNQFSDEAEVVPAEKLTLSGPRNYFYEQVVDLALEKPILGHGFGSFEKEYAHFSALGYANGDYEYPAYENLSHPHNELVYWWIEGGILGLAGLLLAAYFVLRNIFKIPNTDKKMLFLALFFPIVLHTQTEIPFYTSIVLWFIFLTLILLVDVHTDQYKEKKMYLSLLPGMLAFLIPALVTIFMLTTLQSGRLLNQVESDLNVEVSILEKITNPVVWQDRLLWDMNFGLLALAVYQDRPELAVNYIEWATEIIKRKPRAGYYQFLVVAYKVLGDDVQVKAVQAEALYLFPGKDFDLDITVFRGINNKNIDEIQPNMLAE